jgi:hypothetical protein
MIATAIFEDIAAEKRVLGGTSRHNLAARESAAKRNRSTRGGTMSALRISRALILGVALLPAMGAFAETHKKSVKLFDPATLGETQLKAGDYSVVWEGEGPNFKLNLVQGKKVVATVPAHSVDLNRAPDSDGTATKTNADGSRAISQIFFRGHARAFEIGGDGPQTAAIDPKK